jgi:hypothetical protein
MGEMNNSLEWWSENLQGDSDTDGKLKMDDVRASDSEHCLETILL